MRVAVDFPIEKEAFRFDGDPVLGLEERDLPLWERDLDLFVVEQPTDPANENVPRLPTLCGTGDMTL